VQGVFEAATLEGSHDKGGEMKKEPNAGLSAEL
jgi:hypothetical protein